MSMNTGLAQGPFRDDGRHCQQVLPSSQFLVEGFFATARHERRKTSTAHVEERGVDASPGSQPADAASR